MYITTKVPPCEVQIVFDVIVLYVCVRVDISNDVSKYFTLCWLVIANSAVYITVLVLSAKKYPEPLHRQPNPLFHFILLS